MSQPIAITVMGIVQHVDNLVVTSHTRTHARTHMHAHTDTEQVTRINVTTNDLMSDVYVLRKVA